MDQFVLTTREAHKEAIDKAKLIEMQTVHPKAATTLWELDAFAYLIWDEFYNVILFGTEGILQFILRFKFKSHVLEKALPPQQT